jgi:hypothetical protein
MVLGIDAAEKVCSSLIGKRTIIQSIGFQRKREERNGGTRMKEKGWGISGGTCSAGCAYRRAERTLPARPWDNTASKLAG